LRATQADACATNKTPGPLLARAFQNYYPAGAV
jgi:hypothetical protein